MEKLELIPTGNIKKPELIEAIISIAPISKKNEENDEA